MSEIDLEQLAREIRNLERHLALYKVLKGELSKLGYWKNKKRGKLPFTRLNGN